MVEKRHDKEVIEDILKDTNYKLKKKQFEALDYVLKGKDVLCLFPTGYGKSLIFQVLPKVCKELRRASSPTVIVVSPLVALINDQVSNANKSPFELKATTVGEGDVKMENFNIIFGTPEAWLNNSKSKDLLSSPFMIENLVCLVVDEVHKVSW